MFIQWICYRTPLNFLKHTVSLTIKFLICVSHAHAHIWVYFKGVCRRLQYTYNRICMWTYLTFCFTVAQLLLTFAVRSKWSTFVVLYVSQYSHALSTKQKNIELINVLFCWNEWAPTFIFVFYFWSGVGEILNVWLNICTVHNSLSMFYVKQTIHTRRQEILF